jgi:phosphonoacetaldehyde hydrolase
MSGNGVGLSPAQLAALSPEERSSRIAAAGKALYAAGADIVIDSVATLIPALQEPIDGARTSRR